MRRGGSIFLFLVWCPMAFATVPEQTGWEPKNCDGTTTGFACTFQIQAATDVAVYLVDTTTDPYIVTALTLTTHYTVSVANGRYPATGFTVTTVSTYSDDYQLVITTDIDLTETGRPSSIWNPGLVQAMVYKSRLIDNELDRRLKQTIHNPEYFGTTPTVTLPEYGSAGYLYRDAAGNISLTTLFDDPAYPSMSDYWATLVLAPDSDTSRGLLDLLGTTTWGEGTDFVWTMDGGGATNQTLTFSNGLLTMSHNLTVTGVVSAGSLTVGGAAPLMPDGDGSALTSVDAATGDSATAFFDAGTIEHEWGGLEADVSAYDGLVGITAGATYDINTPAELEVMANLGAYASDILAATSEANFKAIVNLEIGTDVEAHDPNLTAIAGLTTAANKLNYWTGAGTTSLTDFTAFARTILDDASALIFAGSTQQDRTIDVRWHGATGSGDQYAVLQAAITDAITGEMGVTIPPGTYRLETGLAIGAGAWEGGLVLDGIGWPKFDWAGAVGGTVLTLTSINESQFSGFIVDGNNIADVNGIRFATAPALSGQRNTFTNVTVWECPGYGIHVKQEPDATGDHFLFTNSLAYGCGTGVWIEGGAREVQFNGGTIAGNTVGVDVNGGRFIGYDVVFGDNGTDMVISDWLSRIQLYGWTSESDVILTTSGRAYDGDTTLGPNIMIGGHQAELDSPPTSQVIDYNAYEPILFIGNRFQHDVNMYSQCAGYVSLLNEFSAGTFIGTGADKCLMFTPTTNRLGVGESAPEYRLHVNSGTDNNAALLESTDAGVLLLMRDNTTTAGVSTEAMARIGNELDLRTNGVARLKISGTAPTAGYVAIGYDHFHNMLDVAGDVNVPTGSGYLVNGVPLYDAAADGFVDGNDTAYDATSWDGNVNAPTMNTIRDKFNALAASDLTNGTTGTGAVVLANSPTLVGGVTLGNGTASAGYIDLKEDSDNGTSRVRLTVSADVPADKTVNIGLVDQCLASGTVNMQAGDPKTTVYTVPAGLSAIITKVIIRNPSASLAAGTDFDIGDGANADTWKQNNDLSTMTATTDCIVITNDNTKYTVFDAADQFGIKPGTGATADATATMMVFGIEF